MHYTNEMVQDFKCTSPVYVLSHDPVYKPSTLYYCTHHKFYLLMPELKVHCNFWPWHTRTCTRKKKIRLWTKLVNWSDHCGIGLVESVPHAAVKGCGLSGDLFMLDTNWIRWHRPKGQGLRGTVDNSNFSHVRRTSYSTSLGTWANLLVAGGGALVARLSGTILLCGRILWYGCKEVLLAVPRRGGSEGTLYELNGHSLRGVPWTNLQC